MLLMFQSPRSGKFESNTSEISALADEIKLKFQSPRSGKFESNTTRVHSRIFIYRPCGFNPLDRGNLNQIMPALVRELKEAGIKFQSPRSGKFESNWKK